MLSMDVLIRLSGEGRAKAGIHFRDGHRPSPV
jgi:hypothetical protein